jgi:hypothetical protein
MVTETTKIRKTINDIIFWLGGAILITAVAFGTHRYEQYNVRLSIARKDAICPSLLSVSRSARDTLIVMKAEPLCNTFVLDSLK